VEVGVKIIHESQVEEKSIPGRYIRWIADEDTLQPKYLSSCVIRVMPGETVRPAHSHPEGEELIYIITGTGKVWIEGEVQSVQPGSTVLFEQGKVHMTRNTGSEEMKVICFFSPPTGLENYRMHEDVVWPEEGQNNG
jgi:quercetin dioxygenase-like cupin family protein